MRFPVIHASFIKVDGMALFPFILIREKQLKNNPVLINHEAIHLWQQIELLVLPFYLFYFFNYLFNLLRYRGHYRAYRQIVFEREAYARENDLTYLKKRELFGWKRFL